MAELGLGTAGRSQVQEAAPNRLDPERMSAGARLQEIASLLAAGFLRLRLHKAHKGADGGLAILRTSSEVCACPPEVGEPSSEGEMSL
jgi:hypothetical protein